MVVVKHRILLGLQILKRRKHEQCAKHPVTRACVADICRRDIAHTAIIGVSARINVVVGVIGIAGNHRTGAAITDAIGAALVGIRLPTVAFFARNTIAFCG